MLADAALARLQESAVLWSTGPGTAAQVIEAACDCLVAGVDSPTLRILAGASCAKGGESDELRRWLDGALTELSLTYYPQGSRDGEEAAVRLMARRALAGEITPRDLTVWAYLHITWDGTPLAAELVAFENSYEYAEAVRVVGDTTADIDADVLAEARRLAGGH
ncbi:hypothetical protein [Micromonospora sp. WMMD980]|uniref:hypothetical protein n=1 Tax=Micromonospora sp. WMMD980 TaxID=3016088 RepID=UPI0024168A66|nr:hypothetical protein [Micromonospora sp. WMMD980]MDG4804620.1 hypothetical protein [Micromonospora sp. WMMD980]